MENSKEYYQDDSSRSKFDDIDDYFPRLHNDGIPPELITSFTGPIIPKTSTRIAAMLQGMRDLRDKEPYGEIRSQYNHICDRIDVLHSHYLRLEENNNEQKEKEKTGWEKLQESQAKGRSQRPDSGSPRIYDITKEGPLCDKNTKEANGDIE